MTGTRCSHVDDQPGASFNLDHLIVRTTGQPTAFNELQKLSNDIALRRLSAMPFIWIVLQILCGESFVLYFLDVFSHFTYLFLIDLFWFFDSVVLFHFMA